MHVTIRKMLRKIICLLVLIGAVVAVQPASAQGSVAIRDVFSIDPGARSIGLGGAFVALADDATAAFANPAGLVQIARPEVSAELRATFSTTNWEAPFATPAEFSGLGFFAFVYPGRRWAAAVYSHQLAVVDFVVEAPAIVPRGLKVTSYAAAGSYRFGERLSLGLGVASFNGNRTSTGSGRIADSDWGLNAGLLWHPSPAWSAGAFFRQGPDFAVENQPSSVFSRAAVLKATSAALSFPDVFGIGTAFRPGRGAWTFAFEWDRVGGSREPGTSETTVVSSGDEIHLGAEFAVLDWRPVVAFRAGVWRESGRPYEVGTPLGGSSGARSPDVTHLALGVGVAFKRFQLDLGFDVSDRPDVISLSVVYSF